MLLERAAGHHVPGQQLAVSGLDDVHLSQHLPCDQLDVLVVDRHALAPIHLLDLVHHVPLEGKHALDAELLVAVHRSLRELLTHLDLVAVGDRQAGAERYRVLDHIAGLVRHSDPTNVFLVIVFDRHLAG